MSPRDKAVAEREPLFDRDFLADLTWWVETDRTTALRLLRLVEVVLRDPIAGIGKPEPLKHQLAGVWSRRLTQEHRVIYLVTPSRVHFLQACYHY